MGLFSKKMNAEEFGVGIGRLVATTIEMLRNPDADSCLARRLPEGATVKWDEVLALLHVFACLVVEARFPAVGSDRISAGVAMGIADWSEGNAGLGDGTTDDAREAGRLAGTRWLEYQTIVQTAPALGRNVDEDLVQLCFGEAVSDAPEEATARGSEASDAMCVTLQWLFQKVDGFAAKYRVQ